MKSYSSMLPVEFRIQLSLYIGICKNKLSLNKKMRYAGNNMVVEFVIYLALGHLYNYINLVPKANSQSLGFYFTT